MPVSRKDVSPPYRQKLLAYDNQALAQLYCMVKAEI
jgi:hypothetical protein